MKIPDPIDVAILEDLGNGDITTDELVPIQVHAVGRIVAREKAIVAGSAIAAEVFRRIEPALHVEVKQPDGNEVNATDVIMEIRAQLARSSKRSESH